MVSYLMLRGEDKKIFIFYLQLEVERIFEFENESFKFKNTLY